LLPATLFGLDLLGPLIGIAGRVFSIFACEGDLTCSILDRFADLPSDSKSSLALFFGFPGFVYFGLVNFAFLFFFGLRSIIKLFCDQKNDWIRLTN
jgi:hypothetical protein